MFYKKMGQPRKNWLQENLRMVWQEIRKNQRDFSNVPEQFESILQAALCGKFSKDIIEYLWFCICRALPWISVLVDTNAKKKTYEMEEKG